MRRLALAACTLLLVGTGWPRPPRAGAAAPAFLTFSTPGGTVGQQVQALGSGLPPSSPVRLIWFRGAPHWQVKDGLFNGVRVGETPTQLATGTTDAQGKVTIPFAVPGGFGYIHTVTLEVAGTALARQGFTVIPTLSISPTSGPVGTPITVTLQGDGYRLYESVWHLLYDSARTGWLSAITTNGTATAVIPATGAVGTHILQALEGTHPAPYLNEQQAPIYQPLIPTVLEAQFRITAGTPLLPTDPALQPLARTGGDESPVSGGPQLAIDHRSGTVGSPIAVRGSGFGAGHAVQLTWSTTVGNRLSGRGFSSEARPLITATPDAHGIFTVSVPTPDDVGGAHTISVDAASGAAPQIAYTLTPSVAAISPATARPGDPITVHLKGVGYTQTANIYTLVLDNNYIGYACGANSQGDVTIHLFAPGGPGTHYVDLYPAIYEGQLFGNSAAQKTNSANVSYFQIPMLNAIDHPGEHLPAFHLSFQVQG